MSELRTAYLSGPRTYRSDWFSTPERRRQLIGYGIAVAVVLLGGIVGALIPALIGSAVIALVVAVLTSGPKGAEKLLDKLVARARWSRRVRRGVDAFEPYDEAATARLLSEHGRKALRQIARYRAMPDGCSGMGWLQSAPNVAGIAWHETLDGSNPYFSVAFEVGGRMQGFESIDHLNRATAAWSGFLAAMGSEFSLCNYVQVLTRVLPPHTVLHEKWIREHYDPSLADRGEHGRNLLASYEQVLTRSASIGTMQRHFVVLRFDLNADFIARARRYGEGVLGWREMMNSEIESATRRLQVAGVGSVKVLTARQVAAFIRHAQDPTLELDRVADVDVTNFGISSRDTRAMHITADTAPGHEGLHWYSATARIEAHHIDAAAKNMFWINGWLVDMPEPIIRTMSFHMRVIPAATARAAARKEETADVAEAQAVARSGSLAIDELEARYLAVRQRANDMRPGSGHQGIEWMGFVTVTAESVISLERHTRMVAERAATQLGINRLVWCRDFQSTASGFTWPIARALTPYRMTSFGARINGAVARIDVSEEIG